MSEIAMIGAGKVGSTLGTRLKERGHTVRYGVPNPADPKYAGMDAMEVAAAVANAQVVFLAIPWSAAAQAIQSAGNLEGKVLVDAINPIAADFSGLIELPGSSAGEQIAGWAKGAAVVKAFNTIGHNIMENPLFGGEGATLLVAGDDADAKAVVMDLARQLDFSPVDAGPIAMSRYVEAFAWVWISLAAKQGHGRDIVLQLLRR